MNPDDEEKPSASALAPTGDIESSESLTFDPPVYAQRYRAVRDLLDQQRWRKEITKVVDFGCSDFKLFKHLKSLEHIQHICAVDVDETLMDKCQYEAKPILYEYLCQFSRNLTVDLYVGNIAEPDSRLLDVDAVICIELIEHLYPETLEQVPFTVFQCIQPKLAVFTTPNSDFNVLFKLEGFRHDDHKFEWSRREFEDWCHSVLKMYDNYEVYFEGIGRGPERTEQLGCVSQMAVFTRRESIDKDVKLQKDIGTPYKLFSRIIYPFVNDNRCNEQKLLDEIKYAINNVSMKKSLYADYHMENGCEIPVNFLWDQLTSFCSNLHDFKEKLSEIGYEIEPNESGIDVIKVTVSDKDSSDSDDFEYNFNDCDLTPNLNTAAVGETWE